MPRLASIVPVAAVMALLGCAPTAGPAPASGAASDKVCFLPSSLANFRTDGDTTVYIRTQRSEVFELRAAGFCRDLSRATSIVVSGAPGSSLTACVGDTVDLASDRGAQCRARVTRQLTEADLAALPGRLRP